jgi:hypothetical protein
VKEWYKRVLVEDAQPRGAGEMEIFNDNPLAVLHLLCALVAVGSGFTAHIYGWRRRPPGTKRPRNHRGWVAMRRWLLPGSMSSLGRVQAV